MAICRSQAGSAPAALALVLALVLANYGSAERNETDTLLYRVGFSHVGGSRNSRGSRVQGETSPLQDEPGPDVEPKGFKIYDRTSDVPEYSVRPGDAEAEKCYVESRKYCVKASYCGHVCEPILLAVKSYCKETVHVTTTVRGCKEGLIPGVSCRKSEEKVAWRACEKARKYNRCHPKVCYKKVLVEEPRREPPGVEAPSPRIVRSHMSIVRYKKPEPKHRVEALRKKQMSARKAVLRP